ncbi:MAG: ACT domain-containing protein, partial [Desulfobacteraceae bacterium]|nr:ACT domain-containing protein [Desulfobacteraceae bacterium]
MNKHIITVLGKDRPGIISHITNILYEVNCNLEN